MSSVVEFVQDLAQREPQRADECWELAVVRLRSAIADELGVELDGPSMIRHLEYDISVSYSDGFERELSALAWLRRLDVAAAPEIAARITAGEIAIVVRRYWSCPGERRLPPLESRFDPAALARYRADTQRIADHGKIHGYARGLGHMSIAELSGTIVLNGWGALQTATADEIREHLEELDENLAMLARWSQLPRRR